MSFLDLKIVDVTLVVDTAIYANGDVMSITAPIANCMIDRNSPQMLMGLVAIDEADSTGLSFDVFFLRSNQSLGPLNGVPNISDAGARDIIGKVSVLTADWKDLGGVKAAFYSNLWIPVMGETDTTNLYIATMITAGTPTFGTASDVKLRLGFST